MFFCEAFDQFTSMLISSDSLKLLVTVTSRVVKLLLLIIVIVIVMKRLWCESNSNSNMFLKIPE